MNIRLHPDAGGDRPRACACAARAKQLFLSFSFFLFFFVGVGGVELAVLAFVCSCRVIDFVLDTPYHSSLIAAVLFLLLVLDWGCCEAHVKDNEKETKNPKSVDNALS